MKTFKEYLSSLFEAPPSPLIKDYARFKNIQQRIAEYGKSEKGADAIAELYHALMPTFIRVKAKFEKLVSASIPKKGIDHNDVKFVAQIKTLESLTDKILNRHKKLEEIGDIVRGALLFKDREAVDEFVKDFRRKNASMVVKYEEKDRGSDTALGYYGSHHLDLLVDDLVVELQVTTKKLWNFKKQAHKLYLANRVDIANHKPIPARDSYASKKIYALANKDFSKQGHRPTDHHYHMEGLEQATEQEFLDFIGEDFDMFVEVALFP